MLIKNGNADKTRSEPSHSSNDRHSKYNTVIPSTSREENHRGQKAGNIVPKDPAPMSWELRALLTGSPSLSVTETTHQRKLFFPGC